MKKRITRSLVIGASIIAVLATLNLSPLLSPPATIEYTEGDVVEKDLYAPISFPIPKDPARLALQRDSAASLILPVLVLDKNAENNWRQTLRNLRISPESFTGEFSPRQRELFNPELFVAADSIIENIRAQGYCRDKDDISSRRVTVLVEKVEIEESLGNVLGFWDADTLIERAAERYLLGDRERASILKDVLRRIVLPNPNLLLNNKETIERREAARNKVNPYEGFVERGELIAGANSRVDVHTLKKIDALNTALKKDWKLRLQLLLRQNSLALFVICMLIVSLVLLKLKVYSREILFWAALIVVSITVSFLARRFSLWWFVPTGFITLAVAMFISPLKGLLIGSFTSILLFLPVQTEPEFLLYNLMVAVAGLLTLPFTKNRLGFVIFPGFVFAGGILTRAAFLLAKTNITLRDLAGIGMDGGINAVVNLGFLLVAFIAAERIFGFSSSLTLTKLADLNHPLFKEFALKASGSYHHSIVVGNLSEKAARKIGGNPILALAGGYYHDIGKMIKPQYFIENQLDSSNPHDALKPRISAMILSHHVKEGLILAKRYHLPKPIRDIIAQHQGTTRMEFFYRKHLETKADENVQEEDFRYPGPKPQTKEAALVMLADSVEASVRAQGFTDREDLERLIKKVITQKVDDGQLDECALTTKDITLTSKVFIETLLGIFHPRISYEKKNTNRGEEKESAKEKRAEGKTERTRPKSTRS